MTKDQIVSTLNTCISPISICKVSFAYHAYEDFLFPLKLSGQLLLSVTERDFQLDGFTVRRLEDIEIVEPLRGTYMKIHKAEGNIERLVVPPINISSWRSVFSFLGSSGETVIVEHESIVKEECAFAIGRILAIGDQGVRFRSFDGAGRWDDRSIVIPYSQITSVTFGSRYIGVYSKYVHPYPEIQTPKGN